MNRNPLVRAAFIACGLLVLCSGAAHADDAPTSSLPKAWIDGTADGFRQLGPDDFKNVNCDEDTWTWKDDVLYCTGQPIGVLSSVKPYTNFELVLEWVHRKPGGNSGVFVWVPEETLQDLPPGTLPHGIEVQILDNAYQDLLFERTGRRNPNASTHGDVFPVKSSTMTPFPPVSPNGQRSAPSKELSKDAGNWNHYYIRAINGELRLWVNGEEVSGGTDCKPATGFLCLESEGSPIEFRNIRIRELP